MPDNRDRAWRRAQAARVRGDRHGNRTRGFRWCDPYPKRWYELYWRKNKLHRARQIGKIWPHREWTKLMADAEPVRLLFVCSHNKWRSPTGERVFTGQPGIEARSAGTARGARHQISLKDIQWADLILVMEEKHKSRIRADYRQAVDHKPIYVLDIPDDYRLMEPDLVELLEAKVWPLVEDYLA